MKRRNFIIAAITSFAAWLVPSSRAGTGRFKATFASASKPVIPSAGYAVFTRPSAEITITFSKLKDGYRAVLMRQDGDVAVNGMPGKCPIWTALESSRCDMENAELRRIALREFTDSLRYMIQKQVFPEDTELYESVPSEIGPVLVYKGFPDESESLKC